MGQLTNRSKTLEQKPLTFWESLYLPAIFKGMAITFGHMFKKKPTINYPEQKGLSVRCSEVSMCSTAMRREERIAQHADCVQLLVRLKPLPWKLPSASQEKKTYTAKRNTLQNMRSICCVVFSVDCVKRLAPKMPSISLKHLLHPILLEKDLYTAKKICSFHIL